MAIFAPPGLLKAEFACGVAPLPCPARAVSALPYSASGVRSALFRERRVAATVFRESGVRSAVFRERALLHCTALLRGQPKCHSEPPRMRRVEESTQAAAKQLQCNHARVPIPKHYCHPARSFDFVPRYARHFAQDDRTGDVAACPRGLIPRTGVIALHGLIARPTAMSF